MSQQQEPAWQIALAIGLKVITALLLLLILAKYMGWLK